MQHPTSTKKPYRAPEVQLYGNVRDVTRTNAAGVGVDDGHASMVRKTN